VKILQGPGTPCGTPRSMKDGRAARPLLAFVSYQQWA
jgi:hypothetical protein